MLERDIIIAIKIYLTSLGSDVFFLEGTRRTLWYLWDSGHHLLLQRALPRLGSQAARRQIDGATAPGFG